MGEQQWERYAAGAGLVGALIFLVQAFVTGIPPSVQDPASEVVSFYARHRTGVQVQLILASIGGIFLLWFFGSLVAHLRRAEGENGRLSTVTLAGALAATGPFAVGLLAAALLALELGRFPAAAHGMGTTATGLLRPGAALGVEGIVRVLADLRWLSYAAAWFAVAPAAAATAVMVMRHNAFPRWFGNASYALFVVAIITGVGIVVSSGPFAPGAAVSYIAFVAFLAWLATASVLMMRGGEAEPRRVGA
ncbi:MAG TPA: hypothetical protein VJN50_04645 [Actinomycetota bacterium]|nr:hypothetical protein [Actinomycetota bacterium]